MTAETVTDHQATEVPTDGAADGTTDGATGRATEAVTTGLSAAGPGASEAADVVVAERTGRPSDASAVDEEKPKRGRPKAAAPKKARTLELTLTVTGTADGEWHAELKQGSSWLARGLPVAAAAVSRAAKELHEDLSAPIDEVIDAAREQQAAKVAALEAELEAARKALAELAD